MKTKLNLFAIGLAGCLSFLATEARASSDVSLGVNIHTVAEFDAPLRSHGAWITVGKYGRCWRPAHVAVGWRPYCNGQWVWTDCGWYWESNEPWAWACYHYGYWAFDSEYGWVWLPGVEWAPAWVEWRVGGGFIGWAPCAPPHVHLVLGAPHFVFVQTARFHEPLRPSRVIVNNPTVIHNTTVINNIRRENRTLSGQSSQRVVVNEGPGVEVVQKASGRRFAAVNIQEAARRTQAPASIQRRYFEAPGRNQPAATANEAPKAGDEVKRMSEIKPAPKDKPEPVVPPALRSERRQPPLGSPRQPTVPRGTSGEEPSKRKPNDLLAPTPGQSPDPGEPPPSPPRPKGKKSERGPSDDKEKHNRSKP